MPALENSDRSLLKATHTPIQLPNRGANVPLGRARDKAMLVNGLQLAKGEVGAALAHFHDPGPLRILEQFEQSPNRVAPKPEASVLADVPVDSLLEFGRAVISLRSDQLVTSVDRRDAGALTKDRAALRAVLAHNAVTTFANAVKVTPIGMLHLERIEMAPAGIERGELVGTIPLAPQEVTNVVQKEWAVTGEEFSSIVTDSLENYSEKGVTEKSELAEATNTQAKHSSQLSLVPRYRVRTGPSRSARMHRLGCRVPTSRVNS